jgi:hypothetical protein
MIGEGRGTIRDELRRQVEAPSDERAVDGE